MAGCFRIADAGVDAFGVAGPASLGYVILPVSVGGGAPGPLDFMAKLT